MATIDNSIFQLTSGSCCVVQGVEDGFVAQLRCQYLDEQLAEQATKNLLFLARIYQATRDNQITGDGAQESVRACAAHIFAAARNAKNDLSCTGA